MSLSDRNGVWGRGPLMMMKDSLFLLTSNVLRKGCEAGEPTNDDEGFFVFANFKCFHQESGIK